MERKKEIRMLKWRSPSGINWEGAQMSHLGIASLGKLILIRVTVQGFQLNTLFL